MATSLLARRGDEEDVWASEVGHGDEGAVGPAGEVVETNPMTKVAPETVNSDPYGDGWLLKLKVSGSLSGDLMDAASYEQETSH
jgi:hypothetical protein